MILGILWQQFRYREKLVQDTAGWYIVDSSGNYVAVPNEDDTPSKAYTGPAEMAEVVGDTIK